MDGEKLHSFMVPVTQEAIDDGAEKNSAHCMIAEAVKAQFLKRYRRKAFGVSVDLQTIRFTDRKERRRYIYLTPPSAQKALVRFDRGLKTEPFKFVLPSSNCQVLPSQYREPTAKLRRMWKENATRARKGKLKARTKRKRNSHIVQIHGGKAPPTAVLTGNRRQFGLRGLGEIA